MLDLQHFFDSLSNDLKNKTKTEVTDINKTTVDNLSTAVTFFLDVEVLFNFRLK